MIPLSYLSAEEWKIGLSLNSDSIQMSVGVDIFQGAFLSLEGGSSWEYQADMRMDDAKFRSVLRYTPPWFKKVSPYISTGFQYSYINTGYTDFWVPGIEAGLGVLFPAGRKNEFYLEGGWQYARKNIQTRYSMESYELIYEETWKAPPFYLGLGWRISPWNRNEKNNKETLQIATDQEINGRT